MPWLLSRKSDTLQLQLRETRARKTVSGGRGRASAVAEVSFADALDGGEEVAGGGGDETGEDSGKQNERGGAKRVQRMANDNEGDESKEGADEDGGELQPELPAKRDRDLQSIHGALDLVRDAVAGSDIICELLAVRCVLRRSEELLLLVGRRSGKFLEFILVCGADGIEVFAMRFASEGLQKAPVELGIIEENLGRSIDLAAELFDGQRIESVCVTGSRQTNKVLFRGYGVGGE